MNAPNPLAKLPRCVRIEGAVLGRFSVITKVDKKAGTARLNSGDEVTQAVPDEIAESGNAVLVVDDTGGSPQVISRADFDKLYREPTNAEIEKADGEPSPAPAGAGSAGKHPAAATRTTRHE